MVNLKCDETCKNGDNCTNSRVYISGLPKGCTADNVCDMFSGLGTIARERPQGRGVFPDMMPFRVKFYGNDDCLLHYEDSHAAHAAPSPRTSGQITPGERPGAPPDAKKRWGMRKEVPRAVRRLNE